MIEIKQGASKYKNKMTVRSTVRLYIHTRSSRSIAFIEASKNSLSNPFIWLYLRKLLSLPRHISSLLSFSQYLPLVIYPPRGRVFRPRINTRVAPRGQTAGHTEVFSHCGEPPHEGRRQIKQRERERADARVYLIERGFDVRYPAHARRPEL